MSLPNKGTLNENTVRLVAFLTVVLVIIFLITHSLVPMLFLIIDFAIRGWGFKEYSPLRFIADKLNDIFFNGSRKPIFAPPKLFAAKVGLLFSVAISLFYFFGFYYTSLALAGVLLICASLEAFVNICVGCYVYSFIHRFSHQ